MKMKNSGGKKESLIFSLHRLYFSLRAFLRGLSDMKAVKTCCLLFKF